MEFTITFGWWLAPLAVTVGAFVAAHLANPTRTPPTGYGSIGDGLVALVEFGFATIVSLIAWLVWAVLT